MIVIALFLMVAGGIVLTYSRLFTRKKTAGMGKHPALLSRKHMLTEADRALLRENTVSKNKPEPVSKAIGETLYSNLQQQDYSPTT
ncbi:hypothetical protein AAG747_28320 [Rapidithrix thailandica]|uniref:Uncharacterized protein n=1 Tax=Rapidithrix thailandica TaxID=413964 RepID=A0AAW9SJ69_9BACT